MSSESGSPVGRTGTIDVASRRGVHIVLKPANHLPLFTLTNAGPEAVIAPGDVVATVVTDIDGVCAEPSVSCVAGKVLGQFVTCP